MHRAWLCTSAEVVVRCCSRRSAAVVVCVGEQVLVGMWHDCIARM